MKYPMKISKRTEFLPVLLVILSVSFGMYFYAHFPDRVAVHWNFAGRVDGYAGRLQGAFAIPLMMTVMYGLFLLFPAIDPKRDRYAEFEKYFRVFRSAIIMVIFAIYLAMGFSNLGYGVKIGPVVAGIIGILMIVLGNYMGKIKNNWFMGIRTPWTLSSENVWNKTHRMGGWMFVLFGLIIILAPYMPSGLAMVLFVSGTILAVLGTTLYSYMLYLKEKNKKKVTSVHQTG